MVADDAAAASALPSDSTDAKMSLACEEDVVAWSWSSLEKAIGILDARRTAELPTCRNFA